MIATDPRILSNSSMWQSERWNAAVTKLKAIDDFAGSMRLAVELVRRRRNFDAVYTLGAREAQAYGLLCALFENGGRPHIASEILLDEAHPESFVWRAKRRLRCFAFRGCARMIVYSSGERELYSRELGLPLERIVFVPFHTNILEPRMTPPGNYGFAAGRSLRDYKTFFAAVEGLDFRFVVVADRAGVAHLRKPNNVELHCDIPRERYLELLEGSRFAVVPLKADYRSTGQVVVLEAASLGKPVVASNVVGVRDYISDGENGLLAAPEDPEALRERIRTLIEDEALGPRLANNALERVQREHTFERYTERCLAVMAEVVGS
jgi:glycosyltransferase involved in cell wall biosynthesis